MQVLNKTINEYNSKVIKPLLLKIFLMYYVLLIIYHLSFSFDKALQDVIA
jgi:hypothetical protein